jgi:uncharacterized damage-inducible protein DinB
MVAVEALLNYNTEVRHRYFVALGRLPWDEFVKNREASWYSMRNIFIHTLNAVDHWLDFLRSEKLHVRRQFDDYKTLDDISSFMTRVEARMREYLGSLTPEGLLKKYTVTNDTNETIEVTAEDVLIHVFEEEVHHRGELIALLWQMGIEPPLMGWKYL